MKSDDDFLRDLRNELISNQGHRATFIKLKLTFVVGLLGLGAISGSQSVTTAPLLYLVPIVALVFDLYILGEDFGIKRIGHFIKSSPAAPIEEHIWENVVDSVRDRYTYYAGPLTSLIAILAAALGIKLSDEQLLPFGWWLGTSAVLLLFLLLTPVFRKRTLSRFDVLLDAKRLDISQANVQSTHSQGQVHIEHE